MGSTNPQAGALLHNVFVYGSLLADDVVRVLLNRVPRSSPAILHDYHRFSIKGRVYPAILPVENKKVAGKVLLDITPFELHILDEFEDVEYERQTIDVRLVDGPEKLQADTYVWSNKTDPDLYGEWDFEIYGAYISRHLKANSVSASSDIDSGWSFAASSFNISPGKEWKCLHKEEFIKMSMGFMEELQLPESKPRVATYESFFQQKDDQSSTA